MNAATLTPAAPTLRRVYRSPLSRVAWVLAPLGLAALTWGALEASRALPDAWAGLALGLLFLGTAAVFGITRRTLELGPAGWRYRRGLLYGGRAGSLDALLAVRLAPAGEAGDGGPEVRWHAALETAEGAIPVVESDALDEVRSEAEDLALALDRPLDAPAGRRSPAAVRAEVADRLEAVADRVPRPQGPGLAVDPSGGLRLPARGWRAAGPAAGAAVLLLVLAGLHLAAAGLGGGRAWTFTLLVFPLEILTGWIVGRSLSAAFAPEEVRLGAGALTVWRPLVRASLKLSEVREVRLARRAVEVQGVSGALHLGAGLDDEGRRALAHALARGMADEVRGGASASTPG